MPCEGPAGGVGHPVCGKNWFRLAENWAPVLAASPPTSG